jgi:hypothetical protein
LNPFHDRAGDWLDTFLDEGNTDGEGTFTFTCQPGSCIVGYWGKVGQEYIGSIGFVERHETAATMPVQPSERGLSPPITQHPNA